MEQIRIILPNPKFTEQCKICRDMFIRLPDNGICPDCHEGKVKPLKVEAVQEQKPVVKEIKPDEVVGANDAIENPGYFQD